MKKLVTLVSIFALSACWSGGRLELFEARNSFLEDMQTVSFERFDSGPKLLKTEYLSEKSYTPNKVLTAYKGYTIADSKTYRKDYYAISVARVNKDGALNSGTIPVILKRSESKEVLGVVTLDGTDYYLIPSNMPSFVILTTDDGSIYKKMAKIKDNKLTLLETDYVPYPEDIRFEPVTSTSSQQTEPVKGFDLKFDGLKDGKIVLTYFNYASLDEKSGEFENIYLENKEGEVSVNGLSINILQATDQKLDYMIMEDEEK